MLCDVVKLEQEVRELFQFKSKGEEFDSVLNDHYSTDITKQITQVRNKTEALEFLWHSMTSSVCFLSLSEKTCSREQLSHARVHLPLIIKHL